MSRTGRPPGPSVPPEQRLRCFVEVNGDVFDEANTAIDTRGCRRCRACDRERAATRRQAGAA